VIAARPKDVAAWRTFGLYLRELRLDAGLSLREVGSALGTSPSFLCLVERGNLAPLEPRHWRRLAVVFPKLSAKRLLGLYLAGKGLDVASKSVAESRVLGPLARFLESGSSG